MNLAALEKATWRNPNAVRVAEQFVLAILPHAVWGSDNTLLVPIDELLALLPIDLPTLAKPVTAEKALQLAELVVEGLATWQPDPAEADEPDVILAHAGRASETPA